MGQTSSRFFSTHRDTYPGAPRLCHNDCEPPLKRKDQSTSPILSSSSESPFHTPSPSPERNGRSTSPLSASSSEPESIPSQWTQMQSADCDRYLFLLTSRTGLRGRSMKKLLEKIGTKHYTTSILEEEAIPSVFILQYKAFPQLNQCFVEYFIRRVVAEQKNIPFYDRIAVRWRATTEMTNMSMRSIDILEQTAITSGCMLRHFGRPLAKLAEFCDAIDRHRMAVVEEFVIDAITNVPGIIGSGLGITGDDPDLLVKDRLVSIIASAQDPPYLQLLIHVACIEDRNLSRSGEDQVQINFVEFWNFYLGRRTQYDIRGWSHAERLLFFEFLESISC
ncbi:hypothetical protein GEMRC1_008312 [Eukaryota sp. GEM-RC1]